MNLSLLLFLIGIFGFVLNRKNIILKLLFVESMLLAIRLVAFYRLRGSIAIEYK